MMNFRLRFLSLSIVLGIALSGCANKPQVVTEHAERKDPYTNESIYKKPPDEYPLNKGDMCAVDSSINREAINIPEHHYFTRWVPMSQKMIEPSQLHCDGEVGIGLSGKIGKTDEAFANYCIEFHAQQPSSCDNCAIYECPSGKRVSFQIASHPENDGPPVRPRPSETDFLLPSNN